MRVYRKREGRLFQILTFWGGASGAVDAAAECESGHGRSSEGPLRLSAGAVDEGGTADAGVRQQRRALVGQRPALQPPALHHQVVGFSGMPRAGRQVVILAEAAPARAPPSQPEVSELTNVVIHPFPEANAW